jgi:hypothetical protein
MDNTNRRSPLLPGPVTQYPRGHLLIDRHDPDPLGINRELEKGPITLKTFFKKATIRVEEKRDLFEAFRPVPERDLVVLPLP